MTDIIMGSAGTLEQIEKQVILIRFRMYRGNKTQTAISLGINVRTLERKLEDYENDDAKQREAQSRDAAEREYQLNRSRGIVGQPAHVNSLSEIREAAENPPAPTVSSSPSGVHVEPAVEATPEHALPVSQRKEVQSVLSKQASSGGQHRRR